MHTLRLLTIFCQPHTTLSEEHLSQRQWSPPSSSSFAMGTEDTTTKRTTNTTHLSFLIILPLMLGLASIMSLSASSESSSSSFTSVLTSSNSSFNSSLRSSSFLTSSFLTPSTAVSADAPGESFVSLTSLCPTHLCIPQSHLNKAHARQTRFYKPACDTQLEHHEATVPHSFSWVLLFIGLVGLRFPPT